MVMELPPDRLIAFVLMVVDAVDALTVIDPPFEALMLLMLYVPGDNVRLAPPLTKIAGKPVAPSADGERVKAPFDPLQPLAKPREAQVVLAPIVIPAPVLNELGALGIEGRA